MKINVTAEHIRQGIRSAPKSCPIALAVLEAIPSSQIASVGSHIIKVFYFDEFEPFVFHPSHEVIDFIRKFDSELPVEPFTFELEEIG